MAEKPQIYVPEAEPPVPTWKDPLKAAAQAEETESPLGDVYDIYGMASNVHSKNTSMTRDYTLANYGSDIINAKFPKFIREQRKVVRILKSFMIVPVDVLRKRYSEAYALRAHRIMKECYGDSEGLFLGEIDEMVIITRAGKGKVVTAMLMHGKSKEEQEEYEAATESGDDMKSKLTEKTK